MDTFDAHEPFAVALASLLARRSGAAHLTDDAAQVGRLALWEATLTYNPRRGTFKTWAGTHVISAVTRYLRGERQQEALRPGQAVAAPSCPVETADLAQAALKVMTARERGIMRAFYWEHRSGAAVAAELQVTVRRVAQVKREALARARGAAK